MPAVKLSPIAAHLLIQEKSAGSGPALRSDRKAPEKEVSFVSRDSRMTWGLMKLASINKHAAIENGAMIELPSSQTYALRQQNTFRSRSRSRE